MFSLLNSWEPQLLVQKSADGVVQAASFSGVVDAAGLPITASGPNAVSSLPFALSRAAATGDAFARVIVPEKSSPDPRDSVIALVPVKADGHRFHL